MPNIAAILRYARDTKNAGKVEERNHLYMTFKNVEKQHNTAIIL